MSKSSEPRAPAGPADAHEERYSIGQLADDLSVTTRAIRFYESRGLLSPGRQSGARFYGRRDRARLMLILRGKRLGFTLEEIGEFLDLYDADPTQKLQLQHLLAKVDAAIADLGSKLADITRTLGELEDVRTKVVEALHEPDQAAR
ncbi:MAG: MerR family transcriptional regulator [Rhizobiales bacterium]|nr:MerR family transcriptional regulator [Hyphomicrobiales bacterium]